MFVIVSFFFFYIAVLYGVENFICLNCKSQCTNSVHLARERGIAFTSLVMKHSTHDYFGGSRNLSGLNEHENCLCYLLLALRKTNFVAEITDCISHSLFKDRQRCTQISEII